LRQGNRFEDGCDDCASDGRWEGKRIFLNGPETPNLFVVKVLWLCNSDEVNGDMPEERRASHLAARLLEAQAGEQVEVIPRAIWPSPELPAIIDGWIDRYSPDIVVFHVNGFWYLYRSIPLLFQRRFGRVGKQIARAGLSVGSTPWIVKTRAYHLGRRLALKTIGGATYFSPEEVCETVESCVRRILRREGVGLVVRAPLSPDKYSAPAEMIRTVDRTVRALCDAVHATYVGRQDPDVPVRTEVEFWRRGDRVHTSAEGHAYYAQQAAGAVLIEWRRLYPTNATEVAGEREPP